MHKPKLLLFDIDGTLLSAHGIPRQAMTAVLKKCFAGFNFDNSFNFSGRTDWTAYEELQQSAPDYLFKNLADTDKIFELLVSGRETEIQNGLNRNETIK